MRNSIEVDTVDGDVVSTLLEFFLVEALLECVFHSTMVWVIGDAIGAGAHVAIPVEDVAGDDVLVRLARERDVVGEGVVDRSDLSVAVEREFLAFGIETRAVTGSAELVLHFEDRSLDFGAGVRNLDNACSEAIGESSDDDRGKVRLWIDQSDGGIGCCISGCSFVFDVRRELEFEVGVHRWVGDIGWWNRWGDLVSR